MVFYMPPIILVRKVCCPKPNFYNIDSLVYKMINYIANIYIRYLQRNLIVPISFIFATPLFAQFPEELGDICYDIGFRSATTDIDPIEGVYTVSIESKILYNDKVIEHKKSDGDLIIYSNSNGKISDYNNKFEFCRIGKTQTYDVNILWPKYNITQHERMRIKGSNFFDVVFSLSYEMPQIELKALFDELYVPSIRAIYNIQCSKILPNKDQINKIMAFIEKRKATEKRFWTGTGFSIAKNIVATNYHVIDKSKHIYIINESIKDTLSASLIAFDQEKDLALLSIENAVLPQQKYRVSKELQRVGTNIFVLGYPLPSTMGTEIKATSGIISSLSGYKGDILLYQISAPVQPGNSGGPLFDFNGNVIGIVCAHHNQAENVGYAIKNQFLVELCDKNGIILNQEPSNENNKSIELSELINQFKSTVFNVICTNQ